MYFIHPEKHSRYKPITDIVTEMIGNMAAGEEITVCVDGFLSSGYANDSSLVAPVASVVGH